MKTHILTLAALAALTTLGLADSPDAILKDYRGKASAVLEKVNTTLEKATVPIISDLVKAGDTAAADEVKTQMRAKQDGEPVTKPHAKVVNLFVLFDAARLKALEPIQQATIRKLDAVLAGADGKKLETVDAVKAVRAEVESATVVAQYRVIEIAASSEGYQLGKLNKGQIIKLQYVEGTWSAYLGWQPESPDQATMPQHRICIVDESRPGKQHEVPSGTKTKPFHFKVPDDAQYTVRIADPQLQSNTGKVSYAIEITP